MEVTATKEVLAAIFATVFDDEPASVTDAEATGTYGREPASVSFDGKYWHIRDRDTDSTDTSLLCAVAEFFEMRGCDAGTIAGVGFDVAKAIARATAAPSASR